MEFPDGFAAYVQSLRDAGYRVFVVGSEELPHPPCTLTDMPDRAVCGQYFHLDDPNPHGVSC